VLTARSGNKKEHEGKDNVPYLSPKFSPLKCKGRSNHDNGGRKKYGTGYVYIDLNTKDYGGYGHWHPHIMFFVSQADPAAWGADLPGSPIIAFNDTWERLTTFLVPVRQWSDGTADR
jgi:hypothetical protein